MEQICLDELKFCNNSIEIVTIYTRLQQPFFHSCANTARREMLRAIETACCSRVLSDLRARDIPARFAKYSRLAKDTNSGAIGVAAHTAMMFLICMILLIAFFSPAQAQAEQNGKNLIFTAVDEELLQQADLFDKALVQAGLVYAEEPLNNYVEEVGKSVLPPGAPPERVQWKFRILRDPLANAFALPNGSIYVTCGLLARLENESQLAALLAHESAHVLERHMYLQNRNIRKKVFTIYLLEIAMIWSPVFNSIGRSISLLANSTQMLVVASVFGYSRELEKEADIHAVKKLLDSHYDPREMAGLFRLLQNDYEAEVIVTFYQDHPKLQDRIKYTNRIIAETPNATLPPDTLATQRLRFLTTSENAVRHTINLEFVNRRFRTALALSQKLVGYSPTSENLTYLADSYRLLGARTVEPAGNEFSVRGRRKSMKRKTQLTPDEEERWYLAQPIGAKMWEENQSNAEEQYHRALEVDAQNARAHLGLGLTFAAAHRPELAIEEYKKCLGPDSPLNSLVSQTCARQLEEAMHGPLSQKPAD
jgi:beta-barrel assembly-enhancing protease